MNAGTIAALIVTAPLLALLVYDLDTARIVRKAERIKPQISLLTGLKVLVYAICVGGCAWVVLGLGSALVNLTGVRILQPPIPFIVIYVAAASSSVGCSLLRRRIRRLAPEVDE